jgi:hypothetical protein
MSQPIWKLLKAADYFQVFVDTTGVYPPEAEVAQAVDENEESFEVFRFPLERLKWVEGYLVPFRFDSSWPYAPSRYREWFDDSLSAVAESCGVTRADLEEQLTSADPVALFSVYEAIGGYHGFVNLDDTPLFLLVDGLDAHFANARGL